MHACLERLQEKCKTKSHEVSSKVEPHRLKDDYHYYHHYYYLAWNFSFLSSSILTSVHALLGRSRSGLTSIFSVNCCDLTLPFPFSFSPQTFIHSHQTRWLGLLKDFLCTGITRGSLGGGSAGEGHAIKPDYVSSDLGSHKAEGENSHKLSSVQHTCNTHTHTRIKCNFKFKIESQGTLFKCRSWALCLVKKLWLTPREAARV